jgi:hypothetical protein
MAQEPPVTGLTPARELDIEVNELTDRFKRVVVGALFRGGFTQHIGQQRGVPSLLNCHVFDQLTIFSSEARIDKVLLAERFQSVVEQVELDVFLVKTQGDGLVIEVALNGVHGECAIRSDSACKIQLINSLHSREL